MQEIDKKQLEMLINKGFDFHQQGMLDDAEPLYSEALRLDDKNAEVYNLIGVLKLQKGEVDEAIDYSLKAISISPCEYFYETLFQALIRKEEFQTIIGYEHTINTLFSNNFPLLFDIAFAYKKLNMHKEALKYYEKALHIDPTSYEGWSNVANIYDAEGRISDAISAMNVCLALKPKDDDTKYYMSLYHFKAKDYKKGLPLFEKRPSKKIAFASLNKTLPETIREDNEWKGENIKDKHLYVYMEAGYGDAIMFARYLPLAAEKSNKLTLMCHQALTPLFKINQEHLGIDEIIDSYIPNSSLNVDIHAPNLSLPYLLGLKNDEVFASHEGYIVPDMNMVEEFRQKYFDNDKIKVGIKWRGNTAFNTDRVIPAELFNQLIDLGNAQYYSFQTFEGSEDAAKLHDVIDIGKDLIDFDQTAAALRNLDLVICNDTSLAHLAGAMRVPCWVLLPCNADWRWHSGSGQSEWYDSVKLFRQKAIGNWQSVFDQVIEEMGVNKE